MKDQRLYGAALFICHLKRTSNKLRTVNFADTISHDQPREQIQDCTDIVVLVITSETGYVAHSYFIGARNSKLLIQIILKAMLLFVV